MGKGLQGGNVKDITWTELKRALAKDIKDGPCLKVLADGQVVGYLVINPQMGMRDRVEGLCGLIDAGRGKS